MHVVIRLGDTPLQLRGSGIPRSVGLGVVGGARTEAYLRDVSQPTATVGAVLRPGASSLLFGVPAEALAEQHTSLEDLWRGAAPRLRDRLRAQPTPVARLDAFEHELAARLPRVLGLHPAVARALDVFGRRAEVKPAVEASGLSHRRFIALFSREVGLTPKRYCRVRRLQRLLAAPHADWAALAYEVGYADQAHLSREFKRLTGMTPSAYRAAAPRHPNHVVLPP